MAPANVLYWFRHDLRLHDAPTIHAVLKEIAEIEAFYPIWILDPFDVYKARSGPNRWKFLLDCLNDLSDNLQTLSKDTRLLIVRGDPKYVIRKLISSWNITHLAYEEDTEPRCHQLHREISGLAQELSVKIVSRHGRTLWPPQDLVKANGGKPTMSFTQVQKAAGKLGDPARPMPLLENIPRLGKTELKDETSGTATKEDRNADLRVKAETVFESGLRGPGGKYSLPTLEELGYPAATTPHRGGETEARKRLVELCNDSKFIATFEKPKTAPTSYSPPATTVMSPHFHFGTISSREFYWNVREVIDHYSGSTSKFPANLPGQLIFRDMYFAAQAALGDVFGRTAGNPQVKFVPWDLLMSDLTGEKNAPRDPQATEWFERWKYGCTGFPWIDALMRQLRLEGWIHHLGRHAVACFLTRGGCYIDWQLGAEVFEEWLIDHEPASNQGNWQWLSCTAFFFQYYRAYSPITFPQKWDREGKFVKHFVPELAQYDQKHIYEPYTASESQQKAWKCRIGGDGGYCKGEHTALKERDTYPLPMFNFHERRSICMDKMRRAYKVGLRGDHAAVQDGSWPTLFGHEDDSSGDDPRQLGSSSSEEGKGGQDRKRRKGDK